MSAQVGLSRAIDRHHNLLTISEARQVDLDFRLKLINFVR